MTPRTIILIFAALLTAGGTIYFAQSWISRERAELEALKRQPVKQEVETQVLVAKKNLPAGLFLKPEDLEWRPWPEDGAAPTYYLKGKVEKTALIGAVVRRGIAAGEPISEGKIARPGDQGFLAAVLEPGMRAVTISVNSTSGIAGFVFPGDRVDLLLTAEIEGEGGKRFATETVLTKLRILAIDQRVNDVENSPKVSKTVTVEVTPKQAEMIAVAGRLGRLSLALRSLAREDQSRDGLVEMRGVVATSASGAGEDPQSDDKSAKQKPDNSVAADSVEKEPPQRGRTVTLDSEASRLVGPRSNTKRVIVIRGAKAEAVNTGAGGGAPASASAAASKDDQVEGPVTRDGVTDETGDDGAPINLIVPHGPETTTGGAGAVGTSTTDLLKRGRL